jgi:hypothetical protein
MIMRSLALCLMLLVLGACSHVQVDARSGARTVNSNASVHVHGGNSLAAVGLAAMLIAGAAEDVRSPQPFPSLSVFSDWMNPRAAPAMQPDRAVSEQDCTKPIQLSDNLRCR